ncbi:MAG: lysophospholipid acyltransferase family protein [Planctomycetota bacterium]
MGAAESRHAPRTGWLRRLLGPLYFTGIVWYRLALLIVRVVPDWLMPAVVACATTLFWGTLPGVRRALAANLELALGPATKAEARRRSFRALRTFAWCMAERYEQFVPGTTFRHSIENRAAWDERILRGEGFVLVTAHLGNWELGSTLPTARSGLEIHLVREPELDRASQAFVEKLLAGLGGPRYRTHFAEGELALGLELLSALRDGHIVALQGDRPRAGGRTVRVPLFGRPVEFPLGVPTIARLAGVPLVPVFVLRTGRREYRVVFRDAIHVPRTTDRDRDHRQAIEHFARDLEWAIGEAPEQWFGLSEVASAEPTTATAAATTRG